MYDKYLDVRTAPAPSPRPVRQWLGSLLTGLLALPICIHFLLHLSIHMVGQTTQESLRLPITARSEIEKALPYGIPPDAVISKTASSTKSSVFYFECKPQFFRTVIKKAVLLKPNSKAETSTSDPFANDLYPGLAGSLRNARSLDILKDHPNVYRLPDEDPSQSLYVVMKAENKAFVILVR